MDHVRAPTSLPPLSRTLEPSRAPKIKVFKNGDPFFTAKQVILRKPVPDLGHLMDYVTDSLRGEAGVRRLYTPRTGTRVTSVEQLEDGQSYVAASHEPFRKMNYDGIVTLRERELTFKHKAATSPTKPRRVIREETFARQQTFMVKNQPKIVSFIRNGDVMAEPFRVIFTKRNTSSWDQVCQVISDKVLMEAAVRKIYTLGGRRIRTVEELEHGETYVAVSRIPFRKIDYKPAPPIKSSPTRRKKLLPPISRKFARVNKKKARELKAQAAAQAAERRRAEEQGKTPTASAQTTQEWGRPSPPRQLPQRSPLPPVGTPTIPTSPQRVRMSRSVAKVRPQSYIITVMTGPANDAGTDAKVSITLFGSKGQSGARALNYEGGYFKSGAVDTFAVEAAPIGQLQRVRIEHDNSGRDAETSAWHCKSIAVRDTITDDVAMIQCDRWLAVTAGEAPVAELQVAVVAPSPATFQRPPSTTHLDDDDEEMLSRSPLGHGVSEDRLERESIRAAQAAKAAAASNDYDSRAHDDAVDGDATTQGAPLNILNDDEHADLIRTSPMRIALESPEHVRADDVPGPETDDASAPSKDEEAATVIQAGFRGYQARKTVADQHRAATTIQAGYRGYKVRTSVVPELEAARAEQQQPAEQGEDANDNDDQVDVVETPEDDTTNDTGGDQEAEAEEDTGERADVQQDATDSADADATPPAALNREATKVTLDAISVVDLDDSSQRFLTALNPFVVNQDDVISLVSDKDKMAGLWATIPKSEADGTAGVDDVFQVFSANIPPLSTYPSCMTAATGDAMALLNESDVAWVVFKSFYCAAMMTQVDPTGGHVLDLARFQAIASAFGLNQTAESEEADTDLSVAFDAMDRNKTGVVAPVDVATWLAKSKWPASVMGDAP
eukprot:m.96763 g.96763  ORF g.96763 m.96763 type:complete len:897 (-) comp10181_c0_seq4:3624-6314(-)